MAHAHALACTWSWSRVTSQTLALLVVGLVLGVAVPVLGMRMLIPSLRLAEKARAVNFRGRRVFYGLGIVWLLWAGCAIIGGVAGASVEGASILPVLTLAGPLALVAFALGVVDDAYESRSDRGFKGHLGAMAHGRLTTGGVKLVGIGLASLVVAGVLRGVSPWGNAGGDGVAGIAIRIAITLVAGAAIALSSNLLNLVDLRPGRALKTYALLSPFALASVVFGLATATEFSSRAGTGGRVLDAVVLGLFLLGPFLAVYRFDLGEEGMLGDAGANPMGAVIGMLIVSGLPPLVLVAWAFLLFALNLASERVSFSVVIAGNSVLSWFDGLGRAADLPEDIDSDDDIALSGR